MSYLYCTNLGLLSLSASLAIRGRSRTSRRGSAPSQRNRLERVQDQAPGEEQELHVAGKATLSSVATSRCEPIAYVEREYTWGVSQSHLVAAHRHSCHWAHAHQRHSAAAALRGR
eukprot:591347-Prorocentrum_minimum.AAC.3